VTNTSRRIHPIVWMILFLPFGVTSGFVGVAIGYLAKQQGIGDAAIAGLVAVNLYPHTFKFLWAPLPDMLFTRRGWYVASNLITSVTLVVVGFVPVSGETLGLLRILIFLNATAVTVLGMATEGLMANIVSEEERGSASGWLQAGNLGGSGVGGGVALYLAQHYGPRIGITIVATSLLACSLALLLVHEERRQEHQSLWRAFVDVAMDLWDTIIRSRTGLLAMILCFLPVGSAAAAGLFSAMAGRWNTSADAVALYTGVLGGIAAAVGCLAGGWLSDQMDRKLAYAITGVYLAVVAVGMVLAPHNEGGYAVFSLAYQFGSGLAYGAFTGFVLEAIGRGAVATKYNALASLSNIPIAYMTQIDGWASEKWSPDTMLYVDAASEVIAVTVFLSIAWVLLRGRSRPAPVG
jgi:MFS transporter, PAT family, beta-lactamase induction signal transducer AmpG